jgi:hypothetical protein
MITLIKIVLVAALVLVVVAAIPDLYAPIAAAIGTYIDNDLLSFMNTVYSIVPDEIMDLIAIVAASIAIAIVASWLTGGRK